MFKLNPGSVQSRLVATLHEAPPRLHWTPEATAQAVDAAAANVLGGFLLGTHDPDGATTIVSLHPYPVGLRGGTAMSVREWRFLNDEVQGLLGSGLVGICRLRGGTAKDEIAMDRKILEKYSGFGVKFAVAVEVHEGIAPVEEESGVPATAPAQPEPQDALIAELGVLSRSIQDHPPVEEMPQPAAETAEPPSGRSMEFPAPEPRFVPMETAEPPSGNGRYLLWAGVAAALALVGFGAWKMTSSGPSSPASVSRDSATAPGTAPSPAPSSTVAPIPAPPAPTDPAPEVARQPDPLAQAPAAPAKNAPKKQPATATAAAKKPPANPAPAARPATAAAREAIPTPPPVVATPAAAPAAPAPVAAAPVPPAPKPDRRGDALRALTGGDSRREEAIRALGVQDAAEKARRESALKALGQR